MSAVDLTLDTNDLALRYDKLSAERQFRSGQTLVARLAIAPGANVLDIGSGTGLLAEYVSSLVGPAGSVVGIDPLPLRVALAQRKARPNLSFEVGNAYDLSEFADDRFDVVYLNAVLHWLPEKLGPLRQTCRVLKSRGKLGISTGCREQVNPLQTVAAQILAGEPYNGYATSARVIHRVSVPELERLLDEAGFRLNTLEVLPNVQDYPSPEAAIEFAEASSFGNFLGHLPPDLRAAARDAIRRELRHHQTARGIRREAARIIAVASKP